MLTVTEPVYAPEGGLKVGVATCCCVIVYVPLATSLAVIPLLNPFVFSVVVEVKVKGLLY
jgi:hypothetical protein